MKFEYQQPNMDAIILEYKHLLDLLEHSIEVKEQLEIISKINQIRDYYFSMQWISYIHYLLDVNSEYWNLQEQFFADHNSTIEHLKLKYYEVLNKIPNQEQLKEEIGNKVFQIASMEVRLMSDQIGEEQKREKELSNAYQKIMSSAQVNFKGEMLSLTQLGKFILSSDRQTRIEANNVRTAFFTKVESQIDAILNELIEVRTTLAKKLGFQSYTDVGYLNMKRLDYDKQDVKTFRDEVLKYVVPAVCELKSWQKQELKLETLMYYDDPILFQDGNAIPKGNPDWIINQALKMYQQISPKPYHLFQKMKEENLFDVESRPGKSGGGITTFIPTEKVPVFISNFNGTSHDIQVLTHEFGHSFQLYSSKDLKYYENWWPTFDACEIHSKSMELLTLPYMDLFFKEDQNKYIYEELVGILNTMCYICLVDEFQHVIYDEPTLSIQERKEKWRSLEKKYMPWLIFKGNDYLERGNTWQKQSHIFGHPFYYIDYALADSVALQFYYMSLENLEEAWEKYISFCSLGGSYSFTQAIERENLKSPFEEETLNQLVKKLTLHLKEIRKK